jgi:hypothetical protein
LDKCIFKCNSDSCKNYTTLRDSGYMNNENKIENDRNCAFLGWEFSHLIFHVFLGYYYNIYISTGISVGYEIIERIMYNCASFADLLINFTGLLIGVYLR